MPCLRYSVVVLLVWYLPLGAAPTPKEVKTKSTLDRVKLHGIGGLLDQPTVRASLKLTKEQEDKIAAIRKEVSTTVGAIAKAQQNNPAAAAGAIDLMQETMDKLTDAVAEFDPKVSEVFTEQQLQRLRQVHLQREGAPALLSRYAVRELGLTAEQEDKLADTLAPLQKPKMFDLLASAGMAPGQPGIDKLFVQRAAKLDAVRDDMLKQLTPEQQKKWKEMVGEAVPTIDLLKGSAEGFVMKLAVEAGR
jgi:Spy/CpxP family protein refolding chaperone